MKKKLPIPILLVLFCFMAMPFKSCVNSDDYDFDKLSEKVDWQPNFVAPIGYGEYSLWYLLNQHEELPEDQTIVLGEDGLIHIEYTEENIFSYDIREVLDFPDQESYSLYFEMSKYPTVSIPFSSNVNLVSQTVIFNIKVDNADVILTELKLDTKIKFTVSNPVDKEITLSVTLNEGAKDGINSISKDFTIPASAINKTFDWDLTGLEFTFSSPSINNALSVDFGATILSDASGTIKSNGSDLDINYQFSEIDFILAKGDFGDYKIDEFSGNIDLDVDFWDDIDGEFTFSDPKINLIFNNQIGIPIKIDANMTASNADGDVLNLDPDSQLPNYPKTETDVLTGVDASIIYDKDNSQIVPFMALPPSENISYLGSVFVNENLDGSRYNPLASGNNINIISGSSSISADLKIDIPLNFKADNLSISDTIDEVDIDDAEKMIKASIIITAKNGLPLDVTIESIDFTDAAFNVLSTISDESIINAASVDTNGDVDPNSIEEVVNEIELTEAQIKSLNATENIIIKAALSTYDEGKQSVKLKGTDKLEFSISVSAQLDLTK